jgi:hypothetical protein
MTEPRPRRARNEHDDAGAYVLDAMDPRDREAFALHLRECLDCRRNVRDFRDTLSGMKELVGQPPPPDLRASLLAAIRDVPQLPPDDGQEPDHQEQDRN